jgi:hypothetical protein
MDGRFVSVQCSRCPCIPGNPGDRTFVRRVGLGLLDFFKNFSFTFFYLFLGVVIGIKQSKAELTLARF